jgi:regulation of enolase protein 1 (concanavalin A-like superfamily)
MKKNSIAIITAITVITLAFAYGITFVVASTGYNDDFTSPPLSDVWTTSGNSGATYDLSTNPGWLTITSPAGCDLGAGNDDAPRILQSISGDFIAYTKVSGTFTAAGTHAGLLAYSDDNHFMRVEIRDVNKVQIGGKNGGSFVYTQNSLGSAIDPIYLKLEKTGSAVKGYWSSDGSTWNEFGSYTLTVSDPIQIGLFVINQNTGVPSFNAEFDYFNIPTSSLFVTPEYPLGTIAIPIAMGAAVIIYKKRPGQKTK